MRPVSFWTFATRSASASVVRHRDFDLHVLAGAHALHGLLRVHLRGRGENRRLALRAASRLSREVRLQCGMPNFCATSSVESAVPPASETTSMSGIFCMRLEMLDTERALPCDNDFHTSFPEALVLENKVTQRRVRARHVIEAIHLAHLLIERTARDEPHDHLDAFGAGFAHVLDERNAARQPVRSLDETVEKPRVPFPVDEARARAPAAGATCRRCRR